MVTERDCQNLAAPRNGSRVPDTETVASGSSLRLSCDIGFYYKGESTQTTCHNGSFIMDISESVCAGKLESVGMSGYLSWGRCVCCL